MAAIAAPVLANQVLASASAIFSWAIREELIKDNPARLVDRNKTGIRERVLSDSENSRRSGQRSDHSSVLQGTALKLILLSGQRPGEVSFICSANTCVKDGWWIMPGAPDPRHRVGPAPRTARIASRLVSECQCTILLAELDNTTTGLVFPRIGKLDEAMRAICAKLGVNEKVTPHDLRRTHGATIAALGFGRDAMNRVQNHKEGGIASVYDRHQYADENRPVMEAVAKRISCWSRRAKPRPTTSRSLRGKINR